MQFNLNLRICTRTLTVSAAVVMRNSGGEVTCRLDREVWVTLLSVEAEDLEAAAEKIRAMVSNRPMLAWLRPLLAVESGLGK